MNNIHQNIQNLTKLYELIKDEKDDVIIRGWGANDYKSEHPEKQNEVADDAKFFYIRKSAFSRFLQRVSDWTDGAKRKQGLARQYIKLQLTDLMSSPQIQGDIKNKLLEFSEKILNIKGDLKVSDIRDNLDSLIKSLTEAASKPTAEAASKPTAEAASKPTAEAASKPTAEAASKPTAEAASKPTAEAASKPTAEAASKPTAEAASKPTAEAASKPTAEAASKPTAEAESKPTAEAASKPATEAATSMNAEVAQPPVEEALLPAEAPVTSLPVKIKVNDNNIEFSKSTRNSKLLSIPPGITFGSKHKADQLDADFYIFPSNERSKTKPSESSDVSILEMDVPGLKKPLLFGATRTDLDAYESSLLASYQTAFEKIPLTSKTSVSIKMPEVLHAAPYSATQALKTALREFIAKHPAVSIYIETPSAVISEKLRDMMSSKPTGA